MARPSSFKPEYCEQAKKLVLLGATDRQLADFFGVTEQTINNWKIKHPEFFEALKLGKEEADQRVEESLYKRAMGYSHPEVKVFNQQGEIITHEVMKHYPPDTTACIFWLKNRKPQEWRDRQEHELSGKDGGAIQFEDMNETDIARRVAFLLVNGADHATH